ncbi:MAG: CHRD domain-containing protein [Solirubrobacterales bacterium]
MLVALITLAVSASALADRPEPKTFVAVLSAAEEVPPCEPADNSARGNAVFHVLDEATGLVSYRLVANNIPGDTTAAHIHIAPKGVPGPIVEPLPFTAGEENGVIGEGTFTNKALLDAMQADPQAYYVNIHSSVCGAGVIRGQLGEHGPQGTAE